VGWDLSGQFMAICSCEIMCPCVIWSGTKDPTGGQCEAFLAFRVEHGNFEGVELAGLTAVIAFHEEGPMVTQHGRRCVLVDAKGDEQQRAAMERFFTGQAGGPPAVFAWAMPELIGTAATNIEYALDGDTHSVKIEGYGGGSCTGIHGPSGVIHTTNTFQPANPEISVAQGGDDVTFKGFGLDMNNTGKYGAYAPFSWQQD
jgi:hypothetical protein